MFSIQGSWKWLAIFHFLIKGMIFRLFDVHFQLRESFPPDNMQIPTTAPVFLSVRRKFAVCCSRTSKHTFWGYGTTQTGYGTTTVWCRGGSRNVKGCWGWHQKGALCALLTLPGALCALLTLPGGHMCFIDTPRGLCVFYCQICIFMFLIDM